VRRGGGVEDGDEPSVRRRLTCRATTRLPYQNIIIGRLKLRSISTSSITTTISTNSGNWKLDPPALPRALGRVNTPCVPKASPAPPCHFCGTSTTLSPHQYAVRLWRCAAQWFILSPARCHPTTYLLGLGMPHAQHLAILRVRASPVKQDDTTLHSHAIVVELSPTYFASTNLRLPGSRSRAEQGSKRFSRHQHTDDSALH
jgi:hypothetical protein